MKTLPFIGRKSALKKLFELLGIKPLEIMGDNPYFQNQTTRHEACQIDLLIQTRMNNLFVCEIKFSKNPIRSTVINEVEEKIKRLATPRNYSCFPVLIHVNGVEESVLDKNYFYKIISFAELLE